VDGRGGKQRIPRPPGHRPGGPPPWRDLAPSERHLTVDEVVQQLARIRAPRPSELASPDQRDAAVLVPLVDRDGQAALVLTKRPDTMPSHQGEIAFPGGKREPTDASLADAALREAHEEIGLLPSAVEIVAELDTISTVASGFSITPFVGVIRGTPALRAHATEVVAMFTATLADLLDPAAYHCELWELWGEWRPLHFFDLPGETVWGATARILVGLLEFLTEGAGGVAGGRSSSGMP
jgi:8-oxo-dGTP pyrophosphatase MutT (NUDIX family)